MPAAELLHQVDSQRVRGLAWGSGRRAACRNPEHMELSAQVTGSAPSVQLDQVLLQLDTLALEVGFQRQVVDSLHAVQGGVEGLFHLVLRRL